MSNVKKLFAHLIQKGVQRKNRFRVEITIPEALARDLSSKLGVDVQQRLSLVSYDTQVPSTTFQINEMKVGFPRKMPYEKTTGDFPISFICSGDMIEKKIFDAWEKSVIRSDHTFAFYDDIVAPEINISLIDTTETQSYRINLLECWPQVIGELQLNSEESDTFMTFQVNFAVWKVLKDGDAE